MKSAITYLFLCFTTSLVVVMSGCGKDDPCENRDCGPQGSCVAMGESSSCVCNDGYGLDSEGQCTIFKIDNYAGQFTLTESVTSNLLAGDTTRTYDVDMVRDQNTANSILVQGLGDGACVLNSDRRLWVSALVNQKIAQLTTGQICPSTDTYYEVLSGSITAQEDGTFRLVYRLDFYNFGTLISSENGDGVLTRK